MLRRRWKPLFAPNHMSDSHQVVIHHISEMVSWISIALHDDLIIHSVVVENYFSMDQVFEFGLTFWYKHPYDIWLTALYALFNFLLGDAIAKSIVLCFLMLQASLLLSHLL